MPSPADTARPPEAHARQEAPPTHTPDAQAPKKGNPAGTRLTHQPQRHTWTPAAWIQRATQHLTAPPSHKPAS